MEIKKYFFVGLFSMMLLAVAGSSSIAAISSSGGLTTFSYTLTNENALEVADAFADSFGDRYYTYLKTYPEAACQEESFNLALCETDARKGAFVDDQIKFLVKETFVNWKTSQAHEAAIAALVVDTSITIS